MWLCVGNGIFDVRGLGERGTRGGKLELGAPWKLVKGVLVFGVSRVGFSRWRCRPAGDDSEHRRLLWMSSSPGTQFP